MQLILISTCLAFLIPTVVVWVEPFATNLKIWLGIAIAISIFVAFRKGSHLPERQSFLSQPVPRRDLTLMLVSGLILYLARGILDFYAFKVSGLDFSVFDQALYNSANGNFMWSAMCDCNHFGIHPTYVLLPFIGAHAVFASPWLLIVLHAVLAWSAIWPLWLLARRYLPNEGLAVLVLIAYLANPWVGSIIGYGFHVEVFYLPAGLWFIWGWINSRPTVWALSALVFLSVKEDAAFYLAGFSIYTLIKEPSRRPAAASLLASCVGTFCLNHFFVQPKFREPGLLPTYLTFWQPYGNDLGSIVKTMLTEPWRVVSDVLQSKWYIIFGSALFLPLLAPQAMFAMLPAILILGTSSISPMRNYGLYYAAPLLPFFFWGLLCSFELLNKKFGSKSAVTVFAIATMIFPFTRNGSITLSAPRPEIKAELELITQAHRDFTGPVCSQLILVPHLPYHWNVKKLSASCIALPGAAVLGHLDLIPYPFDKESLNGLLSGAVAGPSGLLVKGF
jgi:uncharacterized membrane protein